MKHLCGAEVFLYKTLAVSLDQQRLVKVTPVGFHTGTGVSVAVLQQLAQEAVGWAEWSK